MPRCPRVVPRWPCPRDAPRSSCCQVALSTRPRRQRPHAGPLHTFSTWKMAPAVPTASPGPCAPSVPCCSRQGQSQAAQEKVPCWQGRCREARALGVRVHGSIYRKCKPVTASVACAGRALCPALLHVTPWAEVYGKVKQGSFNTYVDISARIANTNLGAV